MKYEYLMQVDEDDYDTYEYEVDGDDEKNALIRLIIKRQFKGVELNEEQYLCVKNTIKELLDFIGENDKDWDDFIENNNYDEDLLNHFEKDARKQYESDKYVESEKIRRVRDEY